jgi:short subunit dehydrogenase-like uncharacterized protein
MALLIYGANGYTGELIARRAKRTNLALPVILAGRRADAVSKLGKELGYEHRVFGLDDAASVSRGIEGAKAVLNCAGPFARTALPMAEACLRAGVHYLDITGEIAVLEALSQRDALAKERGVTLLPAAGFDVVPSDCLAAEAKHRMPAATHLALGFRVLARMSRGTSITTIEGAHLGGFVRRDGQLTSVPSGWRTRSMDFGDGPEKAITIPWGDISTAYRSTRIPNIEVYAAVPLLSRVGVRLARFLGPVLASPGLKQFLIARLDGQAPGPNEEQRGRTESRFVAEVSDEKGSALSLRLITPEGYELTSWTALELGRRAALGQLPIGYQTPATACGRGFILEFEGVKLEEIEVRASA